MKGDLFMFEIKETKTFMDSVHGYIDIPKCFVENLIDTEYFQRLRNVDQTGMRILYPDGKHDRFGHSLGVFYLGDKAINSLLENFSHNKYWNVRSDCTNILFWAKNKVLFLIACLLHDIGHAPFSHSLEKEIHENSGGDQFKAKLASIINDKEKNTGSQEVSAMSISASHHEQLGAMLVLEKLNQNIDNIYNTLIKESYPYDNTETILYAEHYNYDTVIDKKDFESDLCFIARMILGLKYDEYMPEKQIRNCFIELLNGSNFDVDKLDYIVRDTKMSGISNVSIDIERLLKSISIIPKTIYKDSIFKDNYKFSNLTIHSLDNDGSHSTVKIEGAIKGVFRLSPQTRVKISKDSTFVSLNGKEKDARIKYVDHSARFNEETTIYKDGQQINKLGDAHFYKELPASINNSEFNCKIENAKVIGDNDFFFEVSCSQEVEIAINGNCIIEITGDFASKSSITFYGKTKISGTVKEIVVLNNLIDQEIPTANNYNMFSVGFKKQAINIIANVLEARDYLYLWCYAHHKIIYYANFLIPAIANNIFSAKRPNESFPALVLTYENVVSLDDAYIWTVVRHLKNNAPEELKKLCNELLCRKYKISLWKSLAEYDLIFEAFSENEKLEIKNFLAGNVEITLPYVYDKGFSAGFINKILLTILKNQYNCFSKVKNMVFVEASYKQKNTDPHNTFVIMNNEVAPMDKIPLLVDRIKISQRNTSHYFYVYYDLLECQLISKQEHEQLKCCLKDFFERNILCLNLEELIKKYNISDK